MCTVWMRPSVYTTWYVPTSYIDKVKVTTRSSASGTYTDVDSIGNAFDAPVYGVPTVKDVSMTSTPAVLSNGVTVLGMTFLATPVWDMSAIHASQGATVTISSTGDSIFGSTNYNMTISGCVPAAETLEVATAGTTISLNFYGTLTANTVCTITLTSNQGVVYPVNGIWHPLYAVSFSGPVSMQSNYNAFPAVGILGFTVTTDPVGPSTVYTRVNSITMTGTPVRALEATGVSAGIRLNFIADLADGNFVQNQKYLMDVSGCVTTAQTGLPSIYGNPASQLLFRLPLGVNVTATACTVKLYPDPTDTVAMIYTAANYYRVGLSIGKDITGSGSNNCRQYSNTLNLIGSNYIYKMTKLPTGGLVSGASLASVSLMLLAALAAVLALL